MKKLLLVTAFIACACIANSQSNNKVLEVFLNDSAFTKFVVPGFNKDCDTIHIVDTANVFSNTVPVKFYKQVTIENTYSKKPPLKKWYCYNLIVGLNITKHLYYTITYFHEPSNSAGFVKYKLKKGRFKKLKSEYGQY